MVAITARMQRSVTVARAPRRMAAQRTTGIAMTTVTEVTPFQFHGVRNPMAASAASRAAAPTTGGSRGRSGRRPGVRRQAAATAGPRNPPNAPPPRTAMAKVARSARGTVPVARTAPDCNAAPATAAMSELGMRVPMSRVACRAAGRLPRTRRTSQTVRHPWTASPIVVSGKAGTAAGRSRQARNDPRNTAGQWRPRQAAMMATDIAAPGQAGAMVASPRRSACDPVRIAASARLRAMVRTHQRRERRS